MKKIALFGEIHEDGLKILRDSQYYVFNITDYSKQNLIDRIKDVDGIALRTSKLTNDILKECKSLKIVSRHGVGYDNVDLDYLNNAKIALAITGSSNAMSVAEHVMSMFLNLCKLSTTYNQLVKTGNFYLKKPEQDTIELYKKNIFIIGFGRIGKALAKRCIGFETKVYVYDPYIEKKIIKDEGCFPINFIEGIKLGDFISIHLPLNKETKNLITKKELSQMKRTCILVNTARGGIIREKDLVWALQNNMIRSAGLDVFETEPPDINNPLFNLNNIILSPHNSALTIECRKRMGIETCNNLVNYLNNNSNLLKSNIVNKEILNLF